MGRAVRGVVARRGVSGSSPDLWASESKEDREEYMHERIPIVMERAGEVVSIFDSMQHAARTLGMHVSTIRWRIDRGSEVKGELLRLATPEDIERLNGQVVQRTEQAFPKRSIRVRFPSRPQKSKEEREDMRGKKQAIAIEHEGKVMGVFPSMKNAARFMDYGHYKSIMTRIGKGVGKDGYSVRLATEEETARLQQEVKKEKKHREDNGGELVPYELGKGRICITPCPYRDAPKPLVGSALCEACPSFQWKYRDRLQVRCGAVRKGMAYGI